MYEQNIIIIVTVDKPKRLDCSQNHYTLGVLTGDGEGVYGIGNPDPHDWH